MMKINDFLKRFYPKEIHNSVHDIDYEALYSSGIRGLIFDIDNTLEPCFEQHPSERIVALIKRLAERGFEICLLSNNKEARVNLFNETLNVFSVFNARKPGDKGLRRGFAMMESYDDETAIIGDQIFTDIWCGNRFNLYPILVKPITRREQWHVRLKRPFERIVLKAYEKGVDSK